MKTRNTKLMECKRMAERGDRNRAGRDLLSRGLLMVAARVVVAGTLAAGLGACASGSSSSMFMDPATYNLYSCRQLATARKTSNDRVLELERLMAKAETGAAGSLVSGVAYQTDYLSERARRDQIDEKIVSNNCSKADLTLPAPTEQPAPSPAKRRRG